MTPLAWIAYTLLQTLSLYTNKHVLSVLGFQYPLVFQGWQTLVGFLFLWLHSKRNTITIVPLDRAGFISLLPNFLFFTVMIISGSKALAAIPVVVVVVVNNIVPAAMFVINNIPRFRNSSLIAMFCSFGSLVSGLIVLFHNNFSLSGSPYFWLLMQVLGNIASLLHGKIADARYSAMDKLYYSYIFSVIVLAPASLYLEEAFEALNFKHGRQVDFLIGCFLSALFGVSLHLHQSHLKTSPSFGFVHNSSLLFLALLSPFVFSTVLPWWVWLMTGINLVCCVFVPTHISSEEDKKITEAMIVV